MAILEILAYCLAVVLHVPGTDVCELPTPVLVVARLLDLGYYVLGSPISQGKEAYYIGFLCDNIA